MTVRIFLFSWFIMIVLFVAIFIIGASRHDHH